MAFLGVFVVFRLEALRSATKDIKNQIVPEVRERWGMIDLHAKDADTVIQQVNEQVTVRETDPQWRSFCERLRGLINDYRNLAKREKRLQADFFGPLICAGSVAAIAIFGICVASRQPSPILYSTEWASGIGFLASLVWTIRFVHRALKK